MKIRHLMRDFRQPISGGAMCGAQANFFDLMRNDLGSARYKRLGVIERFKDEKPYRICLRCIKRVKSKELR